MFAFFCAAALLSAQEPPQPPEPQTPPANGSQAAPGRGGITPPSQEPQPYEKVITKEAQTKKGIFIVHHSVHHARASKTCSVSPKCS